MSWGEEKSGEPEEEWGEHDRQGCIVRNCTDSELQAIHFNSAKLNSYAPVLPAKHENLKSFETALHIAINQYPGSIFAQISGMD